MRKRINFLIIDFIIYRKICQIMLLVGRSVGFFGTRRLRRHSEFVSSILDPHSIYGTRDILSLKRQKGLAGLSCRTLPLLIPARKHPAGSLNRPRRKNIRRRTFSGPHGGRWNMEVKRRFRSIQRALGTWTDLAHWMPFQEQPLGR